MVDHIEYADRISRQINQAYYEGYYGERNRYFGAVDERGLGVLDSVLYMMYCRGREQKKRENRGFFDV